MSLDKLLEKIYFAVGDVLRKKHKEMYTLHDETDTKCYFCKENYQKQKLIFELNAACGSDRFKFGHLFLNFNDPFLIKNIGLYCNAVNRDEKEYCIKYNGEFKEYIDRLKVFL